jgi:hypothetical protein
VRLQYFRDGEHEYLARTWDADPGHVEPVKTASRKPRPAWNGQDFYVAFGDPERRSWEDAVRYGFVSAGGGEWYSRSLQALVSRCARLRST